MIKHTIALAVIALFATAQPAYCQTDKDKAHDKAEEAIKMEDEGGNIKDAIKLLEQAQKLDPDNTVYTYELGYAYYSENDYKKALNYVSPILDSKTAMDLYYEVVGDCYDNLGKSDKAVDTYNAGLVKFPSSGRLHLELGITLLKTKQYNDALAQFEKGIEVNPEFPSNYYWASLLFCDYTTEKVWGMIYGEIFLNLERSTKRTEEISKLLFDTYKSQITFKGDTDIHYDFTEQNTITINDIKDTANLKLPFALSIYEPCIGLSCMSEKIIDLSSLDRIRTRFIKMYYDKGYDKKYPNVLFAFEQKVIDAGQMEAYNHWLLMKGDEVAFTAWQTANKDKWNSFVKWFLDNKIPITDDNKFYRNQY
jgi:tetratricopeptide (TPR) repeat protein